MKIEADNSSLKQILRDVSADTGAKVEGLSSDERIFGSYGPGQVHEVLAQLLDGSDYNVMIIGGQNRATPLRIVLSAPSKGSASPASSNPANGANQDSGAEAPSPPAPHRPIIRSGSRRGMPPRTPQEVMRELRQRQQEIKRQEEMREREARSN